MTHLFDLVISARQSHPKPGNPARGGVLVERHEPHKPPSGFELVSDFGFRISDFLRISDFGLRICRLALVLLLAQPGSVRAEISPAAFDAANKLYDAGKFSDAVAAYKELTQSGQTSATLYFNLGNAYFKSGQIGRAIAAYRQAEKVTPRDPDVRANLQFARNQVQGPTLQSSRWQLFLGRLTVNEWTLLASGMIWLCLLLLAGAQWRPGWKRALRDYLVALGIAAGLSCACLASAFSESRPGQVAVVIVSDASVRNGTLDESPTNFTVHDGAELRILDQKDDWLQVSAPPNRIGWLRRSQVIVLE
jgi:tetratricopeptide (TPR) repeat protein